MYGLEIRELTKAFGKTTIIEQLSLKADQGEFCVLLGPSGCGKSTVLRLIAGLEEPDSGDVLIDGKSITALPAGKRDIAMVFQSYALYPHMNVFENLAFPLKMQRFSKQAIRTTVEQAARLLELSDLLDRKPAELSGGQRQRVAMGRAIVRKPKLFLFDEPLSNLDAKLRASMRVELANLHRKLGITMLYVTHDQTEAMTLADRIILINEGRIQQEGSPLQLYHTPANLFVATFIGTPQINLIEGTVKDKKGKLCFYSEDITLDISDSINLSGLKGETVVLGIRPEDIFPGEGPLNGSVQLIEHLGHETHIHLRTASDKTIIAKAGGDFRSNAGDELSFSINLENLHYFHKGMRA